MNPHNASVLRNHPVLKFKMFKTAGGLLAEIDCEFPIVGMDLRNPEIFFVPLVHRVPENRDCLWAHIGELPGLGVCLPRYRLGRLRQSPEMVLTFAQRFLRPLALADVADGGTDQHALPRFQRAESDLNGNLAAVLAAAVELKAGSQRTHPRMRGVVPAGLGLLRPEALQGPHPAA